MSLTLKEIYEGLTDKKVIELVMSLGADRYIENSKEIIFPTICHNYNAQQASMKLYYYKQNKMFHCYSGDCESFNIFGLFERRYELLNKEYDFYRDIVLKVIDGLEFDNSPDESFYEKYESVYTQRKQEIKVDLPKYSKTILEIFSKEYPIEWIDEGISKEVMKQFNICYSIPQNKIVIPHYDIDGNLIGIRGRTLDEDELAYGKYLPLKINDILYNHPLMYNLYGLNFNKDAIKKNHLAILAEGEKSSLIADGWYGDNNCVVATCGDKFNKFLIKELIGLGVTDIVVAYDRMNHDKLSEKVYFKKLYDMCKKYQCYANFSFIYDRDYILDYKAAPFDSGREVFEKLFDRRIMVK